LISDYFRIAGICGPHGLDGALRIKIVTDFLSRFDIGQDVYVLIDGEYKKSIVKKIVIRSVSEAIVVLDWINDRDLAEKVKGCEIFVSAESVKLTKKDLPDDEFYYYELIGAKVYQGERLVGELTDLINIGSNDILVVKNNGKEYLIPFIGEMVNTDSLKEGKIFINPIEGLLS